MYGINNSQVFLLVLYASFFVFSVFLSTILNFLLFKFASTLGIRNNANNLIRWSNVAKPALGGITFFIIYLTYSRNLIKRILLLLISHPNK